MAKIQASDDDLLFSGSWLEIRAMRRANGRLPAAEWFDRLSRRDRGRFLAAAQIIENTLRSGRPPAGRAGKVKGSAVGLWELRVTPAGGTPPHLRLLYLLSGHTMWAAAGFTKQKNYLEATDRAKAEGVAAEWLKSGGQG